jgi:hypothetical protein
MKDAVKSYRQWRHDNLPAFMNFTVSDSDPEWRFAESLSRDVLEKVIGGSVKTSVKREADIVALLRKHVPDPNRQALPFWNLLINKILIETAASKLGHQCPPVVVDILPMHAINALTVPLPGSKSYVITVDFGLRLFSSLTMKVFADAWRQIPRNLLEFAAVPDYFEIWEALRDYSHLFDQFQRILVGILIKGQPEEAVEHAIPELRFDPFSATLESAAEVFILAHEYGHILAGHSLGKTAPDAGIHVWLVEETPMKIEINENVRERWNKESQADRIALDILFEVARIRGWDWDVALSAADLSLTYMDILDKGRNIVLNGNTDFPPSHGHPPMYTRREILRKTVRSIFPSQVADTMICAAHLSEYVMKVLFDSASKVLIAYHLKQSGVS